MSSNHRWHALTDGEIVARFLAYVQPQGALTQTEAAAELTARGPEPVGQATVSRWIRGGAQKLHAHTRRAVEAYLEEREPMHADTHAGEDTGEGEEDMSLEADRNLVRQVLAATDDLTIRAAAQVVGVSAGTMQRWRDELPQRRMANDLRNAARAYLRRIGRDADSGIGGNASAYLERAFALLELDGASGRDLSAAFLRRSDAIARLTALLVPGSATATAPAAPSAVAGRPLTPDDFAGGVESPGVEVRDPAKTEDQPPH